MPRIPRYTSEKTIRSPFADEFSASRIARAGAQAGESLANVGLLGMKIAEAEQNAERALKSLEIEKELRNDIDKTSESYYNRIDYENFDKDIENQINEIHDKYQQKIGTDQALGLAFERLFTQHSATLRNVIRDKKRQIITEKAQGEYLTSFNQSLEDYSLEIDPAKREIIKKNLEMKTMSLVANHLMTMAHAEANLQKFEDVAESVRANKLIEIDALKAEKDLKSGEFDLSPTIKQRLIEKAIAQQRQNESLERIKRNEEEKRQKEAEKEAHDAEEKQLSELFLNGKYSEAHTFLGKAKYLKGGEIRVWESAIKQESRMKPELDYAVYAEWSYKVNLDPKSIKSASEIWGVRGLTTEKKKELSDLWEKKITNPDDPKGNRAKRYHAMLKAMQTKDVFGNRWEANSFIKYGEKANQLDKYFKANPDATDKEVEDYFKDMVKEETDAWWSKAWNTISNFFSIGATPEAPLQAAKEDEKRKKAIKILEDAKKPVTEKNIKHIMDQM